MTLDHVVEVRILPRQYFLHEILKKASPLVEVALASPVRLLVRRTQTGLVWNNFLIAAEAIAY